jgi:hypothetical protein
VKDGYPAPAVSGERSEVDGIVDVARGRRCDHVIISRQMPATIEELAAEGGARGYTRVDVFGDPARPATRATTARPTRREGLDRLPWALRERIGCRRLSSDSDAAERLLDHFTDGRARFARPGGRDVRLGHEERGSFSVRRIGVNVNGISDLATICTSHVVHAKRVDAQRPTRL